MIEALRKAWEPECGRLLEGPFFRRLRAGDLNLTHYTALLRETYYNTRENPNSFALMSWHLQGRKRELSKSIWRHCGAEFGHHELALEDLRALGEDASGIPEGRPLPTTEALIAFAVFQIQFRNPLAYFGYIYHLEMLPARIGPDVIADLKAIGVPTAAMAFLTEHAHADTGHIRWMEDYLRVGVASPEDLEAVIHGAKSTCRLHGVMLQGILDAVDGAPDWTADFRRKAEPTAAQEPSRG